MMKKTEKELKEEKEFDQRLSKCVSSLPESVRDRFKHLKILSDQRSEINDKMEEEIRALEFKYDALKQPLFEARAAMLKQCEALSQEQREKFTTLHQEVSKIVEENNGEKEETKVNFANLEEIKQSQGIPGFWLQAFKNHKQLSEMVLEKDEPVLKHLVDVRAEKHQEDYGFTLRF